MAEAAGTEDGDAAAEVAEAASVAAVAVASAVLHSSCFLVHICPLAAVAL